MQLKIKEKGMKILVDINGNIIKTNSLISWNVYDGEDYTQYTFIGIVHDYNSQDARPLIDQYVVYLGGGIDFGRGIGKKLSFGEVINESENNDEGMTGITVLGSASSVPNILKKHFNL
jgi:hypothetical protein